MINAILQILILFSLGAIFVFVIFALIQRDMNKDAKRREDEEKSRKAKQGLSG